MPKLSIIVPVYNTEKYLVSCLDSLLCQSVIGGYEIICINDGSKDSSAKILDTYANKYPETIRVLHKENGGVSKARNFGISKAKGKYITFVDSDDYLLPNSVGQVVKFLEKENAVAAIMENHIRVKDNVSFSSDLESKELEYKLENISSCNCWSMIIQRSILIENNIYFPDNMKIGEDTVFVATCQLYYWDKCLSVIDGYYCYRQNPSSVMHTRNDKRNLQSHLEMMRSYNKLLPKVLNDEKVCIELKKQFKSRLYTSVGNVLFVALFTGDYYVDELKQQGLYPYPFQWWILKSSKNLKVFCINMIKFLFPILPIYWCIFKICSIKRRSKNI